MFLKQYSIMDLNGGQLQQLLRTHMTESLTTNSLYLS